MTRATPRRPLLAAAGSDTGLQREINEDRTVCDAERGIFAVIDGVGGEAAGERGASTAADILLRRLSRLSGSVERRLREAITLSNNHIYELAHRDSRLAGMSCVLTAAVVDGETVTIGHVGDTRLYRLGKGRIEKLTSDHSPVGALEDAGALSETEAMRHPQRNEILRDVGSQTHDLDDEGFVDLLATRLAPDEALVLCSDGLTDQVTSTVVSEVVERFAGDPQAAVEELIARANAAGGKDNVSVVIVEGERFADAVQRSTDRHEGTASVPLSVAAHAPESPARKLAVLAVLLIILALVLYFTGAGLRLAALLEERPDESPPTVTVGGFDGDYASIGEALEEAGPGWTIEVAPGEYDERVELVEGVTLVSRERRRATIRLGDAGSDDFAVAVIASGLRRGRFAGFRIAGDADAPLEVGLRLVDSSVVIEDVEISGAQIAAIDALGADRSTVDGCDLHDNPGAGVRLGASSSTWLKDNLIRSNGLGGGDVAVADGALEPGVHILPGALPRLSGNVFKNNGAAAVWVPDAGMSEPIELGNSFEGPASGTAVALSPRAVDPAASPSGGSP